MAEYKIGFSAYVKGVDQQSLDKASKTITDYMQRNTNLHKAFKLPDMNTEGAKAALAELDAKVVALKKNIATIRFNSGGVSKELDVSLEHGGLKIISETRNATATLEEATVALKNKMVNLKVEIKAMQQQYESGNLGVRDSLIGLEKELERVREESAKVLGVDGASRLEKQYDGAILSVEELADKTGEVTRRVVTLSSEGDKVRKVFQNLGDAGFEIDSEKLTSDFKRIEAERDKLASKLKNLGETSIDPSFRAAIEEFKKELGTIDVYSVDAKTALKNLGASVETLSNKYNLGKQALSQYKTALKQQYQAQLELRQLQFEEERYGQTKMMDDSISATKKNVEVLTEQRDALRAVLEQLGLTEQAQNALNTATADFNAKQQEVVRKNTKDTSLFNNFISGMKDATARIMNYTIIYRTLWAGVRAFKDSIQVVKDLDAAFTDIQMVMLNTSKEIENLKDSYAELAYEMSSTVSDVAKGATEWLNLKSRSLKIS